MAVPRRFVELEDRSLEEAKITLPVEQNPQALAFETANTGIVADLRNVLTLLIQELKKGL